MHAPRFGAARIILAGALVLFGLLTLASAPAIAASQSFDVGDQSIVQLQARTSIVTIRVWDRNTVQVDWNDGEPFVAFHAARPWTTTSFPIPAAQNLKEIDGPNGALTGSFPPEDFPLPPIAAGPHDIVRVSEVGQPPDLQQRAQADETHLTVTIPNSTRLLFIRQGRGDLTLSDYRGTTIAFSGGTRVLFNNVGGNAFVQNMFGHVYAINSTFDRIRVRTNHADQVFEGCRITQIDAQSLVGNIVLDNSSFEPGLARIESDRGDVALGITGNALVGAHTQDGRTYTMMGRTNATVATAGSDQSLTFGGGGTIVTATSTHGNIYAYDGSIADHAPRTLGSEWRPVLRTLLTSRNHLPANVSIPHGRARRPESQPRRRRPPAARFRARATAKTSAARQRRA